MSVVQDRTAAQTVASAPSPVSLSGTWVNQLGSRLILEQVATGALTGSYVSGVGELAGVEYPVTGFCDPGAPGGSATLGFVVRWAEDHSVTAWSGHYDPSTGEITAMWLLTCVGAEVSSGWKTTLTGQDVFRRAG